MRFTPRPPRFAAPLLLLLGLLPISLAAQSPTPAPALPTFYLKRLLIAETEAKTLDLLKAQDAGPVVDLDHPLLASKEFADFIKPFFGQPLTTASVHSLGAAIVDYLHHHDRPVVNVNLFSQNFADINAGTYRMVVIIGRYNQLEIKGNRYFSSKLLEHQLGIKPGDEIRLSTLEEAVNWTNSNPFNHVQVLMNAVNKSPGVVDLDVEANDQLPVRAVFSYDDTGNDIVGNNHYTASVQLGNLWGLEHQLTYQFTTSDDIHNFQSHSLDYRAPLPWRHYLEFSLGYSIVDPTFEEGHFRAPGKDIIADLRYIAPLTLGSWSVQLSGGIDYKQLDNSILFLESDVTSFTASNSIDSIAQFVGGITAVRHDPHGAWAFFANGTASPGNFNGRNTDATFGQPRYPAGYFNPDGTVNFDVAVNDPVFPPPRLDAVARYLYGTLQFQRLTTIPFGMQLFTHALGQISSANLLGSEEMSIGGQATVRGYDERVESGDEGFTVTQEIQSPQWNKRLSFLAKRAPPLMSRLLLFWDYGHVYSKIKEPGTDFGNKPLMSTGVGLRSALGSNFSLSADYGWQILETTHPVQPDHCRGDITATLVT